MQKIIEKFRDRVTPKGNHAIRVDESRGQIYVWYLFWGDYQGVDSHHHMGIATVRPDNAKFSLGVLHGTEQSPRSWTTIDSEEQVIEAIEKVIAER